MDSDQDLLDAANAREDAREVAEWKLKKTTQQRYENAAKHAHSYRYVKRLLVPSIQNLKWEEMSLSSQENLIAEAEVVDKNTLITAADLSVLYKERLLARGDTENSDLGADDESTPKYQSIESEVLKYLKEYFHLRQNL